MRTAARTVHALCANLVDYAGLFPPASLDMAAAVACYDAHRCEAEAWMLGRFVVPVARLGELAANVDGRCAGDALPWRIAAIGSGDPARDGAAIIAFNDGQRGRMTVDVAEHRAATVDAVRAAARATPPGVTVYVELPIDEEPRTLLEAVRAAQACAKVRTGGVVPDAFPATSALARFIVRCAELGVPFKATAGLHHPLRAEHPLTYLPDAPRGTMFGFLSVFAAAAFARAGLRVATVAQLLEERDPSSLAFDDTTLRWRTHSLTLGEIVEARTSLAISFGSCSFREPADDLRHLHLIAS